MIMKDKDLDIAMCMFAIVSGLGIPIILLIWIAKKLGVDRMKKYQIIYADPAWHYMFGETSSRYVDKKYNCMTKEELCDLPIIPICADSAVLLMWVTYPKLDWAFDIIKAWGFEYKTVAFTWIKRQVTDSYFGGWAGGRGRMPNCAYFLQKASQNASAPGFTL